MEIELLADHPDWVPLVAEWHWDEWGHFDPNGSLSEWAERLADRTNRNKIPMTFVAVEEGRPVGSAALVAHDMKSRQDLSPWLSGVYVLPKHRSRGVASKLVQASTAKARELGVQTLYLFTDTAVGLYRKLGWQELEVTCYQGREVTIMYKRLDG